MSDLKLNHTVKFHWSMHVIGLVAWAGAAVLTGRLIWESTILSWEQGPQMVGFALIHSRYAFLIFFPIVLWGWLAVALYVTLRALWKKRKVSMLRWVALSLTVLLLGVWFLPSGFWEHQFADRISRSPHAVKFLNIAAASGDFRTVEALLSRGIPVNATNPDNGQTALHAAAVGGDVRMVGYLVSLGFNVNAINHYGNSPLENALSMENDEVASFLSSHGALRIQGDESYRDSVHDQIMDELFEEMKSSMDSSAK